MPSVNGIDYVHTIRYFAKGIDQQGPYYQVEYELDDWGDTDAFVNGLLGLTTGGPTSTVPRAPHRHPLSPNLMCMAAGVVGLGKVVTNASGYPSYAAALVQAQYRAPGPAVGPVLFSDEPGLFHHIAPGEGPILWATQEIASETETITLPDHAYVWATSGDPFPSPFQLDINRQINRLVYHQLPFLPIGSIRALKGRINSSTFLGAPAEQLLFREYATTRQFNTDGSVVQRVQLDFIEQEWSWNKFLLPGKMPGESGAFDYVQSSTGGRRFQTADLRPLGRLGSA
jgi:hypothetical protein